MLIEGHKEKFAMKATVYGLLAAVIALVLLAMPMKALAHEHHGWGHDNGNHWGWYKHQGGGGYGAGPGFWHHHDHDWDHHDHDWYEHHGYGGYGYGYNSYPGNYGYGGYPGSYSYPAAYSSPGYGYGGYPGSYGSLPLGGLPCTPGQGSYYGSGYAPNAGKLMQLQQTMTGRLYNNQALYQAAMAQGNYGLANKAAARMQNQSATISAANAMLAGGGSPIYSGYNQPAYGMNPYCGQSAISPLGSIFQMFGY